MKYVFTVLSTFFILTACQNEDNNQNAEQDPINQDENANQSDMDNNTDDSSNQAALDFTEMSTENWDLEVIADDLTYPWDIRVLDDVIVMPEVEGNMIVIENGETERFELETSDPIAQEGGSGLLGLELADDFSESGTAYVYYTYHADAGLTNKVVEVVYDGDAWQETEVLLDNIPGHELYNGGRIAIGPDENLYVTTGWAREGDFSQDLENLGGKILRMHVDGSIPEDNPFDDSYVYSYGHRNPQGVVWNEDGTVMYSSEHGESGYDEINIIEPGNNYGWPEIEGDEEQGDMVTPLVHSGSNTWAPSGITYFEDHLFVTGLRGQSLYVYNEAEGSLDEVFSSGERLRNVYPYDGDLYVITTDTSPRSGNPEVGDRVFRLTPNP